MNIVREDPACRRSLRRLRGSSSKAQRCSVVWNASNASVRQLASWEEEKGEDEIDGGIGPDPWRR